MKTSLQMLLVQARQFFPDAFGYISVPSALHLSDPFSMIYDLAIFHNQVLTNIWHSAPHHSGRPRKLFCVRRKQASWCSERLENDRGQSPTETQRTVISSAINPLPHLSVDPRAKEEDLTERADGVSQKMGWKSKCVFIFQDCFNFLDKCADIPPKLTSEVHLGLKITESDRSLGLIALFSPLLLFLHATLTDRARVMHCR